MALAPLTSQLLLWIGLVFPIKLTEVVPQNNDNHTQQQNQRADGQITRPRQEVINKGNDNTHTGH